MKNVLTNFVELENLLSCVPGMFRELLLSCPPVCLVTLLSSSCCSVVYHQDRFSQSCLASSAHPASSCRKDKAPCRQPKRAIQGWLAKKPLSGKGKHLEMLGQLADGRWGIRQDIPYGSTTACLSN